jgi:hypothetical protein
MQAVEPARKMLDSFVAGDLDAPFRSSTPSVLSMSRWTSLTPVIGG